MTERLSRFQNTSVINCPPWLGGNWEQERWRGAAIVLKLARGCMRRIRTFSAAAAQMIAGAAQADLARVGPNSPAPPAVPTTASSNGFPLWYQDSPGGMVLELCPLRQTRCRPHFLADDPHRSDTKCKEVDTHRNSKNRH